MCWHPSQFELVENVDALVTEVVLHHVQEIYNATAADDHDDLTPNTDGAVAVDQSTSKVEVKKFFDGGESWNIFDHFKALTKSTDLNHIGVCALKMIQLIQLGKVEKGTISMSSKVNLEHGRWFR